MSEEADISLFMFYILVDATPPEVSNCPETGVTATLSASTTVVAVQWPEPTAIDNSQLQVQVEKTHSPGQFFSQGITEVVYTFRDSVNNAQECRFMVIVSGKD